MSQALIRRMRASEIELTALLWQRSQRAAYTWFREDQRHPLDEALAFFRESICRRCELWVAVDDTRLTGLLALEGAFVDHLFVDPDRWREGLGTLLLDHAKALHPAGLELVTLVRNRRARLFYEAHGFETVRFGVSPPPESEPDVYYRWRPSGSKPSADL